MATKNVTVPPNDDSWISPARVKYYADLLQALVLFLALPYLLARLLFNPARTLQGATSLHAAA